MTKNSFWYSLIGLLLIFIIWYFGNIFFPDEVASISDVTNYLYTERSIHFHNLLEVIFVSFIALLLAIITMVFIVIIVAINKKIEPIITPSIVLLKTTPVLAFIPLIIAFSSNGNFAVGICSYLICFFPLVISGIDGLKRLPSKLKTLNEVYGASGFKIFKYSSWGFVLENVSTSLKISAPLSVVGTIVGQSLISGKGLGGSIVSAINDFNPIKTFIAIVLCATIGFIFYLISHITHNFIGKTLHITKQ